MKLVKTAITVVRVSWN